MLKMEPNKTKKLRQSSHLVQLDWNVIELRMKLQLQECGYGA